MSATPHRADVTVPLGANEDRCLELAVQYDARKTSVARIERRIETLGVRVKGGRL